MLVPSDTLHVVINWQVRWKYEERDSTLVEAEAQVALYSNSLYQYVVQVAGLNPDVQSPSEKQ